MLYTFYGDDLTGSTDVLEQLASNGVPAVLFLSEPNPEHLARFANVKAIGIAGDSRSRSPEWMTKNLPRIFTTLKSFNAPVNHYKVCSTFDSSPTHGSIGRALDIGREVFHPAFVPIVVAAPHLGRYVIHGNLFAVASDGQVKRIDQHPMANHPVTPMREPDLRRHLAAQTRTPIGLISTHTAAELNHQLEAGTQAILFDGADEQTLTATGELLWHHVQQSPLFAIGSSGLTAALIPSWRTHENKSCHSDPELVEGEGEGEGEDPPHFARSGDDAPWTDRLDGAEDNPIQLSLSREKAQPLLVLSGSCSPVTAGQIQWALANGFHGIALDPSKLLNSAAEQARIQAAATASLAAGRSTILYTALGPPSKAVHGDDLGEALGNLLRNLLQTTPTRRILLCGGDTSSHAVQQLGLYALTWTAPIQAGAPLCRAHSDDPMLDSIELILKGGQVGTPNFFHAAQQA